MNKKLLGFLLLLCVAVVMIYGIVVARPFMQTRQVETERQMVLQSGFDRDRKLGNAFRDRLIAKVKTIDKAGYKGDERKRRIHTEVNAAKKEEQRVRNSNFTLPYRME